MYVRLWEGGHGYKGRKGRKRERESEREIETETETETETVTERSRRPMVRRGGCDRWEEDVCGAIGEGNMRKKGERKKKNVKKEKTKREKG